MAKATGSHKSRGRPMGPNFAAIDLGTNNCRLLIASPRRQGFRIVDSYSRIVRLGEGVSQSGQLSEKAMDRTLDALSVCAEKIKSRRVKGARCIATQACRVAENGDAFLRKIYDNTGLTLEIVSAETEAQLSVRGCKDLIDDAAKVVIVFDIGGGSTEISWVRITPQTDGPALTETVAWTSLPIGVVTLAEDHGELEMSSTEFDEMALKVRTMLDEVDVPTDMAEAFQNGQGHLIGTSGTVTSLAGVHLKLEKYDRAAVDGLWMSQADVDQVCDHLRMMSFEQRAEEPCIGRERADLVVPGSAILKGLLDAWPTDRIRVGDRGLREGMLIDMIEDWRQGERRRKARRG